MSLNTSAAVNLDLALSVLKIPDPRLFEECEPIVDFGQAREIAAHLDATLVNIQQKYNFKRGSGIAAPQIGFMKRVFVIDYRDSERYFVNPEIVEASDEKFLAREGCFSLFDYRGDVPRSRYFKLRAQRLNGEYFEQESIDDNHSSMLQHENGHLNGELYYEVMGVTVDQLTRLEGMPSIP